MRTPLPLSYSRHTSRFLSIWSFTLPFVLVDAIGWMATVPTYTIICWMLFGIEDVGLQIEQPFSATEGNQGAYDASLPVDALAAGVVRQIDCISALECSTD